MPVHKRDYYDVLGIKRDANPEEIKSAYKRLAFQHHPDRNKGNRESEEKFKELGEAYEFLSDPEKRAAYDLFGNEAAGSGSGAQTRYQSRGGAAHEDLSHFEDLFKGMFGDEAFAGAYASRGPGSTWTSEPEADLQYELTISLEEAFEGAETKARITGPRPCSACQGSGAEAGSVRTCWACRGSGELKNQRGFLSMSQTCANCGGTGQVASRACSRCQGQGEVSQEETVKVRIPPGVRDGTVLRAGQNLYVAIRIQKHSRFTRKGDDLITEHEISIPVAALGGETVIQGIDRPFRVKIAAGTQPGTLLRVRRGGMPHLNGGGRGDLLVRVGIEIPSRLTKEQRKLFIELADSLGERNAAKQ